jgi:hypothetical protein
MELVAIKEAGAVIMLLVCQANSNKDYSSKTKPLKKLSSALLTFAQ